MTQTKKFSQFDGPSQIQNGDIVVGLRGGVNYQFSGVGSGGSGGGAITLVVNQDDHGFTVGDWIRVNSGGIYVKAQSDTSENAEIAGTVLNTANANQFTIQVVGFVGAGVFSGLTEGAVYFLSDTTPGAMTLDEPVINGEVSIPVFIAVSATTGWIRQWRGFIIGGQPSPSGGGSSPNPNIVTVNQDGHGLNVGQFVRLAGSVDYVPALADSLSDSQAVGVVIQRIDANNFVLQTAGYNIGAVTQDYLGNPIVAATIYYLSPTLAGAITSTVPASVGQATKPLFICEQGPSTNAGYILEQRPLLNTAQNIDTSITTVTVANSALFSVGDWLYISGSQQYTKGIATSLAASQVIGVVVNIPDGTHLIIQSSGYNIGAVTLDSSGNPIVPGTIYYLSPSTAGKITATVPMTIGQVTKPLFSCEQTFGVTGVNAGYILEQRPLIIVPTPSGGGEQLITTVNASGNIVDMPGILNGTYQIVRVVGENLRILDTGTSINNANAFGFQLYTGGVLRTSNQISATVFTNVPTPAPAVYVVTSADVRFGLPAVAFATAVSGTYVGVFAFDFTMYAVSQSSTPKYISASTYYNNSFGVSVNISEWAALYYADSLPITGLKFQLLNSTNIVFISGTISVYGTQT